MSKVAIVQQTPVFLDRSIALQKTVYAINEAAMNGAKLIIFPEAFIAGYPAWVWRLRPGTDSETLTKLHTMALSQAISMQNNDLLPVREAAKAHQVTVVCGMNERDTERSQTTLYNTVVTIGPDGELLNRHRKLMPTNAERTFWGLGDASGLKVVETPCGRIGSLICWESYMPLSRTALYEQGIEIYIAPTYDSGENWICSLRHIAREAGCWVLGAGNIFQASDIPDTLPGKQSMYLNSKEWVNSGDSVVIAPDGTIVAGPLHQEQGILYAEIDLQAIITARRSHDVVGHSARHDVFHLNVTTTKN
jgi:nitrilase